MALRTRHIIAPAILLAAGLLAAGCAKKNTIVNPDFRLPEGRYSDQAMLITWPSSGAFSLVYQPQNDDLERSNDRLLDTVITYPTTTPGAVHIELINGTQASAFELFGREPSGAFARLREYDLVPIRKWLDGHWSLISDLDATPGSSPEYVARGVVGGAVTADSPLTNLATPDVSGQVPATLVFDIARSDSLQRFEWTPDPAASGYFVEVISLGSLASRQDRIASADAAPFVSLPLRDYITLFVPQTPAPAIGLTATGISVNVTTANAIVFANRGLTPFSFYIVRVTAIDASGRVINRLKPIFPITYDFFVLGTTDLPEGSYEAIPVGGPVLAYGPTPPTGSRARPADTRPGWHFATER